MGQAKLRRGEIECLRRQRKPRIGAVHEAGHAVARFLTADRFGIAAADAVVSIEMYLCGGTTFGPMFSLDLAEAAARVHARYSTDGGEEVPASILTLLRERPNGYFGLVMDEACNSGADIATWLEAKITQCVAGPMAEAIYRRRAFEEVIRSPECRTDIGDIWRAWKIAQLGLPNLPNDGWKQRLFVISKGIQEQFSAPATWAALLAVARSLPEYGTMSGRDAWDIFCKARQLVAAAL